MNFQYNLKFWFPIGLSPDPDPEQIWNYIHSLLISTIVFNSEHTATLETAFI